MIGITPEDIFKVPEYKVKPLDLPKFSCYFDRVDNLSGDVMYVGYRMNLSTAGYHYSRIDG